MAGRPLNFLLVVVPLPVMGPAGGNTAPTGKGYLISIYGHSTSTT